MTTVLKEGRIEFTFDPCWVALHWDVAGGPYRDEGIEKLGGTLDGRSESTKSVDFVARRKGIPPREAPLLLIEVKDISREEDLKPLNERALEIALKVRDTIAGIQGVVQRNHPKGVAASLGMGQWFMRVKVVAWVPTNKTQRLQQTYPHTLWVALRKRLQWLTRDPADVVVYDPLLDPPPDTLQGVSARALSA